MGGFSPSASGWVGKRADPGFILGEVGISVLARAGWGVCFLENRFWQQQGNSADPPELGQETAKSALP